MNYDYKAKNNLGEIRTGVVEAFDEQSAVDALRKHDLTVILIAPSGKGLNINLSFFNRVKQKELVVFSRQLATLMEAKVPLVESLRTLVKQSKNQYFKDVIFKITNDISGGVSFSIALKKYPKVFSEFYVSMVESGEVSGRLQDTLSYLADYLENNFDLMKKVKGAMMYPAFLVFALIVVGILMLVLVVPNLTSMLTESGQELPIATKILVGLSSFMVSYWWIAIPGLFGSVIGGYWSVKWTKQGKMIWDKAIIRIPIFGKILRNVYIARLTVNLGVLISSGIPMVKSMEIVGDIVGNLEYKKLILAAADKVKAGETISSVFGRSKLIPPLANSIISVGEKTGKLDLVLKNIGKSYQKDVDAVVGGITKLIEPVLMVIMGLAVAVMVAAILLPIYQMTQAY